MSKAKLLAARELIKEKEYEEARTLLKGIDHPTAKKWLDKLDEISPESKKTVSIPYPILIVGGVGISVVIFVLIFVLLTNGNDSQSEIVSLPTAIVLPTTTPTEAPATIQPTATAQATPTEDTSEATALVLKQNLAVYCFPIINLAAAADAHADTDFVYQVFSVELYDSSDVQNFCDAWATIMLTSDESDTIKYCQKLADEQFRPQTFGDCLTERNFVGNYLFDLDLLALFDDMMSRQLLYDMVDDDIIRRYGLNN
jgi:hypothetical protein